MYLLVWPTVSKLRARQALVISGGVGEVKWTVSRNNFREPVDE